MFSPCKTKVFGGPCSLPPPRFWWLPTVLSVPRVIDTSLQSLHCHRTFSLRVSVSSHGLFIRALVMGPRTTMIRCDLILACLLLQRPSFQTRSRSQIAGVRIWAYLWGGALLKHCRGVSKGVGGSRKQCAGWLRAQTLQPDLEPNSNLCNC